MLDTNTIHVVFPYLLVDIHWSYDKLLDLYIYYKVFLLW